MKRALLWTVGLIGFGLVASASQAATQDDFQKAYAAAESANKEAGKNKNQWTPTFDALAAAKKASASGQFDEAVALANRAEALAKASIAQSQQEEKLWKDGVIR
jgi:hypothetical protein